MSEWKSKEILSQKPEEHYLMNEFINLTNGLMEDNMVNMSNTQRGVSNINELFSLQKSLIQKLINSNERVKAQNKQLRQKLRTFDPTDPLLAVEEDEIELTDIKQNYRPYEIRPTGMDIKLNNNYNYQAFHKKCKSEKRPVVKAESDGYFRSTKKMTVPITETFKRQIKFIKSFVEKYLSKFIKHEKGGYLPKSIPVNIYLKWAKERQYQSEGTIGQIKSQITNILKFLFPKMNNSERFYKDVFFIQQVGNIPQFQSEVKRKLRGGRPRRRDIFQKQSTFKGDSIENSLKIEDDDEEDSVMKMKEELRDFGSFDDLNFDSDFTSVDSFYFD